jgi:uncharacterized protein (TIGR02453 family)
LKFFVALWAWGFIFIHMGFELILSFLQRLAKNNNRPWFEKNKSTYLDAKGSFDGFIEKLLPELVKLDEGLAGLNPRKLAFRIYRDIRFSKDKRPYKTNMGAGFSPGGKLIQEPGFYVHIEPSDRSFLAGGLYMPDNANLAKIRQEIDYNTDRLLKIVNDRNFKKLFGQFDDFDKLKSMPRGFSKDHPHIELLKHKSFIVSHKFTDKQVRDKSFVKLVAKTAKSIQPLNEFLKEAIV